MIDLNQTMSAAERLRIRIRSGERVTDGEMVAALAEPKDDGSTVESRIGKVLTSRMADGIVRVVLRPATGREVLAYLREGSQKPRVGSTVTLRGSFRSEGLDRLVLENADLIRVEGA